MSLPLPLVVVLLALFSAVSGYAVWEHGYLALWRLPFAGGSGTLQLFADLFVAMFLVTTWMVRDSRTSGVPALPWIVVTVLTGSFGPLGYLLHRRLRQARSSATQPPVAPAV